MTAASTVQAGSGEILTVNGAISNLSSFNQDFTLSVDSGANATYAGGSAGLTFSQLIVGSDDINTTGLVDISAGLTFTINSLSSYGQIGSVDVAGATINIGGGYTGHYGDTFDLTSGNFASATLGSLPTLSAGLSWDTSDFLTDGVIEVVPEPSFFALLTMGLGFLAIGALAKKRFGASLR